MCIAGFTKCINDKNIQIMGNVLRFVGTELLPLIHVKSHPKELRVITVG